MIREVSIACAGAGKTYNIITESLEAIKNNNKILVLTYTTSNQREILNQFHKRFNSYSKNFVVKGIFQFLLEDLIRPYQRSINRKRITGINFNSSDPHKRNNRAIKGRSEKLYDGKINKTHYFTDDNKAHTMFLSKLAVRICKQTENKPIKRIEEVYDYIYIDEVQDLVGWDYELISLIEKESKLSIKCVGDFRQTIYKTALGTKQPLTSLQKINKFASMNFKSTTLSINRRSIQEICDFAHQVHKSEDYPISISGVEKIPEIFHAHTGVFLVKKSEASNYINKYSPVLLRWGINSGKEYNKLKIEKYNFGEAKGLGFNRVLIIPTDKYLSFLKGNHNVFNNDKTEEAKNKLYVAITRARYSVAFIVNEEAIKNIDVKVWNDKN